MAIENRHAGHGGGDDQTTGTATTDVGPLTDAGDRLSATVMVQIDSESEFSGLVLTAQTRGR